MTTCKECRFWQASPNDNDMGTCTGIIASGRVEVNAGSYNADDLEFFTPASWYCADSQPKEK